jgi:hypothetical protein
MDLARGRGFGLVKDRSMLETSKILNTSNAIIYSNKVKDNTMRNQQENIYYVLYPQRLNAVINTY